MDKEAVFCLEKLCEDVRKEIARCGYESGRGHISSALSSVEILVSLYFGGFVDIDKVIHNCLDRDRVILSKGHAGLALYSVLIKAGVMEHSMLEGFTSREGKLSTHPVLDEVHGIEMSSGSLGQGIGFACGTALAEKMQKSGYHTYVIVGDGELQEGSNWESMLFASQMKLNKLTVIVDQNGLQISGKVDDINAVKPLKEKFDAFGFYTIEVDGHNVKALTEALEEPSEYKPKAIIANTVKGKGISFIENRNGWHGKGLTLQQYQQFLEEVKQNHG